MTQDELKKAVARAALAHVVEGEIVGVGTGSTANCFIDELADRHRIRGAVASSEATGSDSRATALRSSISTTWTDSGLRGRRRRDQRGNADDQGRRRRADARKNRRRSRPKIRLHCRRSKLVPVLGRFPLPVEVIPMALGHVRRELAAIGGKPLLREGFVTDNGNLIVDVHGLQIVDAVALETRINQIVGVVTNGLFACRPADVCLLGTATGVQTLTAV
jgi:ribose 5-phosphate isomerase A